MFNLMSTFKYMNRIVVVAMLQLPNMNHRLIDGGSGVRLHDGPDLKLFILVVWDRGFRLLLGPSGLN